MFTGWGEGSITGPEVYIIDPGYGLQDCLRTLYGILQGEPMLHISADCSSKKTLTEKIINLSELVFSGHRPLKRLWLLAQTYNAVLKDL